MTDLPVSAICLECGYSLRGLSQSRCPECGLTFDPGDPRSYGTEREKVAIRIWGKPQPLWVIAVAFGTAVSFAVWRSFPCGAVGMRHGAPLEIALASVILCGALLLDYVLRCVYCHRFRRVHSGSRRTRFARLRWCSSPLFLLLITVTYITDWPLDVRFAMSRDALDKLAADDRAGVRVTLPVRAGLYEISYIGRMKSGALFFQTGLHMGDRAVLMHDPNTTRPREDYQSSRVLSGGWRVQIVQY